MGNGEGELSWGDFGLERSDDPEVVRCKDEKSEEEEDICCLKLTAWQLHARRAHMEGTLTLVTRVGAGFTSLLRSACEPCTWT